MQNNINKKMDDEDDYECQASGFGVSYLPDKTGTYFIEINSSIRSVGQFSSAIQVLEQAGPDDEVIVKLSTPGGSLDAADTFIHALRKCKAPIHMIATGSVSSAGSAILLEAESFELSENFSSLIHCGGCGTSGNTNEVIARGKFLEKFMPRFMRNTYEGFLSTQEIEDMIKGCDIWLTAEDWVKRHEARNEYIMAKIEAMTKPEKKARKSRVKKALDVTQVV